MTDAAKSKLIDQMISEAYAEDCELAEITPSWIDYQLQRIFHDYRGDYRSSIAPDVWAELDKWEKAKRQSSPTIRQLAEIVAGKFAG